LEKPFDAHQLFETVRSVIGRTNGSA